MKQQNQIKKEIREIKARNTTFWEGDSFHGKTLMIVDELTGKYQMYKLIETDKLPEGVTMEKSYGNNGFKKSKFLLEAYEHQEQSLEVED